MNILLIGATGKIGKNLLTNKFSDKYDHVYALVRSDENVKLVESVGMIAIKHDIENYDFKVLKTIDKVFLVTTPGPYQVELQNKVLKMCSYYEVKLVVRISTIGAQERDSAPILIDKWHIEIEKYAENLNLPITHIRPNFLMDNLGMYKKQILSGILNGATGDGEITMISSYDVVQAIDYCLLSDGHIEGNYVLTGSEPLSMYDVVEKLSAKLGMKISYQDMLPDKLYEHIIASGKPEWFAIAMKEIVARDRCNGSNVSSNAFENLLNTMPMTFDQFTDKYISQWK